MARLSDPAEKAGQLHEAMRMLAEKYPGKTIQLQTHTNGDFIELRCGEWNARVDMTFLAIANPSSIAIKIEELLHLRELPREFRSEWNTERLKQILTTIPEGKIVTQHTNSPTEQWAEDWAKNNEKGKGSV